MVIDESCELDDGIIIISNQVEEGYLYLLDGIIYQVDFVFVDLLVGIYILFVCDSFGCEVVFEDIEVEVFVLLEINEVVVEYMICVEDNGIFIINIMFFIGVSYLVDGVNF